MRADFERWADKHLAVPRWIISTLYILFVGIGIGSIVLGVPTVEATTPNGYAQSVWGIVVTTTAAICALASLRERFEVIERWPSVILCAFLLLYPIGAFVVIADDLAKLVERGVGALALTVVVFIPCIRCIFMLARIGRAPKLTVKRPPPTGGIPLAVLLTVLLLTAGSRPAPAVLAPTPSGVDLSWLPQALTGVAAIAAVIISVRNSRRDRTAKRVDLVPPTWPEILARFDLQDKKIRLMSGMLTSVADQWPPDLAPPRFSRETRTLIKELDDTLVPEKWRALKNPRSA
jgi:hypothetical protein